MNIYLSGKLTEEQQGELVSLLETPAATEQFEDLVRRQLSGNEFTIDDNLRKTEDRVLQGVIRKIQSGRPAPVRRIRPTRKWGWAAAAVLVISTGLWFWFTGKNVRPSLANNRSSILNDVAPGSDKAILTLSDGKIITLDSTANGVIAQQGNTSIVRLADGRLSYNLKEAATGASMLNTMRTPRGGQYRLILPDGTQVWLNAASSITYPAAFTGKERKVKISGEAYFEVTKDKEKPFIVDVDGRSSVEVLGTHFDINSYTNEGPLKTTLLEGSVRITATASSDRQPGLILKPGQQASISWPSGNPPRILTLTGADIDKVMAWKNGLFNFEDAGLEEVMRQVERWYDVKVIYEKSIPNIRFEGEISRNINLSDLLKVLARAEVKFRIEEGRRLVVLP